MAATRCRLARSSAEGPWLGSLWDSETDGQIDVLRFADQFPKAMVVTALQRHRDRSALVERHDFDGGGGEAIQFGRIEIDLGRNRQSERQFEVVECSLQPVARRPVGVAAEQRQVGTRAGHDPPGASQGCCRGADGLESKQRRGAGHQVQPPAGRQMRLDQVKNSVISGVSNQPH